MLQLQVASTEAAAGAGPHERRSLAPGHGMLFVFDDDGRVVFWMKTRCSLDMIFSRSGWERCVPLRSAYPLSRRRADEQIPRRSGMAKFVIQLVAGEAKKDGMFRIRCHGKTALAVVPV